MEKEFDIHFRKEGNTWTASLQNVSGKEETAGFGVTPEEALKDLFLEKDKARYQDGIRDGVDERKSRPE